MGESSSYDVVVVGASIAGTTAATLFAREGLRVGLVEAHRDPQMYKRLCTHYIQSSATPVLERLGVTDELDRLGAVRNAADVWTSYGWIREPDELPGCPSYGYSVRRQVLDPLLRRTAEAEPNVDLLLGAKVVRLDRDAAGRVSGVGVDDASRSHSLAARLVVGADGNRSKVAELADLPATELANNRFGYFATYRGVRTPDWPRGKMWLGEDGSATYVFPNEDGVAVLATMPPKSRLDEFRDGDLETNLLAAFDKLEEAPDLSGAERVSDIVGTRDYPNLRRQRITAPGVALAGDAAMTADPLWGIGCGWALQSAAWLVDATVDALRSGRDVDAATRRYERKHRRFLGAHFKLVADFATVRPFNPLERLLFGGAPYDDAVSAAFWRYGTRNASPSALLSPPLLLRAARARRRGMKSRLPG